MTVFFIKNVSIEENIMSYFFEKLNIGILIEKNRDEGKSVLKQESRKLKKVFFLVEKRRKLLTSLNAFS